MATPTYIALANYTVPSGGAASVTFSSIPATYRDLVVFASLRTERAATNSPVRLQFNGNATNGNYSRVAMFGDGSTASSYKDSPTEIIIDGAAGDSATAGVFAVFRLDIMDYSATDKHKSCLTVSDLASFQTRRQAARWASTNPITSIYLQPYFGEDWKEGSTFALYGIAS